MELVKVRRHDGVGSEIQFHKTQQRGKDPSKSAFVFHGVYDLKYYLDRQELTNTPKSGLSAPSNVNKALCLAVKRLKND